MAKVTCISPFLLPTQCSRQRQELQGCERGVWKWAVCSAGIWGGGWFVGGGPHSKCLLLQCSTRPLKSRVKDLLLSVRGLGDKVVSRKRVRKTESHIPSKGNNRHDLEVGTQQRTHRLLRCSWKKFRGLQDGILPVGAGGDGRI